MLSKAAKSKEHAPLGRLGPRSEMGVWVLGGLHISPKNSRCFWGERTGGCRALQRITRWPLKVALCHNTLVPTTPAAVKCHRPLLSAGQPATAYRRQPPVLPPCLLHSPQTFPLPFTRQRFIQITAMQWISLSSPK